MSYYTTGSQATSGQSQYTKSLVLERNPPSNTASSQGLERCSVRSVHFRENELVHDTLSPEKRSQSLSHGLTTGRGERGVVCDVTDKTQRPCAPSLH